MDCYVIYCKGTENQHLLTIPVTDVAEFTTKPLKWIRYATFAVLGSKGDLKEYNDQGDCAIDYEDSNPPQRKLLFIPEEPVKFVDQFGLDHLESPQFSTESRADFKDAVVNRDGICVLTDFPPTIGLSAPCHLIPRSKGTEYIQALCRSRAKNAADKETEIADIDDVRNGILVEVTIRRFFSLGLIAVLPTPNFALAENEVLPPPTRSNPAAKPPSGPFRFTPHFITDRFNERDWSIINSLYRGDFRYPTDIVNGWPRDWPPMFLWDFIYGVIVAKRYGNKSGAMKMLSDSVETSYYPQGIKVATDAIKANRKEWKRRLQEM